MQLEFAMKVDGRVEPVLRFWVWLKVELRAIVLLVYL